MVEQVQALLAVLDPLAEWSVGLIILVTLVHNGIALLHLAVAAMSMTRSTVHDSKDALWQQRAPGAPPVAIIAPAYNEAAIIEHSLQSLLSLRYPHFEVIVVNDGSRDDTLDILKRVFELRPTNRAYEQVLPHKPIRQIYRSARHPNLVVIDKENGGKADALNAGINVSRAPLFCAVDSDSMLESEALLFATQPFREDPERVIAVGGTIRVANGCRVKGGKVVQIGLPDRLLPLLQSVEYIRSFLIARVGMSRLGVLTLISGAFGVFSRNAALEAGGYATDTVGEDYELVLRMHRHHLEKRIPYRIVALPEPVCWTEVPDNLKTLANQRKRWQRGALETFSRHSDMVLNPRYGRLGAAGMGASLVLDVVGPLAEGVGYVLVPLFYFSGLLEPHYALSFLALTVVFGIFISAGSLVLEELALHRFPRARDLLKLGLAILVENFGYRQLCNWWRLQGWIEYLRKKQGWGEMVRTGFRKG